MRTVIATAVSPEHVARLQQLEPRLEIVHRPELFPFTNHEERHVTRDPDMQREFEAMLDSAEAIFSVPDQAPAQLARTVAANPALRWVHTIPAGGGAQVRAAALTPEDLQRVAFTTSAGVHAVPLAEFALFGVLAGLKEYGELHDRQMRKQWGPDLEMRLMSEARVAVVGLGSIGRETARLLSSVGMHVIGVHRRHVEAEGVQRITPVEELAALLAEVDAVVLALPHTDATIGLVSRAVLAAAKPGLTIVNVGRGTAIDELALVDALANGQVATAFLDVTAVEPNPESSPLWQHPRVFIAPHTAAVRHEELGTILELFADNARRLLDGEPMRNRVNIHEFY